MIRFKHFCSRLGTCSGGPKDFRAEICDPSAEVLSRSESLFFHRHCRLQSVRPAPKAAGVKTHECLRLRASEECPGVKIGRVGKACVLTADRHQAVLFICGEPPLCQFGEPIALLGDDGPVRGASHVPNAPTTSPWCAAPSQSARVAQGDRTRCY